MSEVKAGTNNNTKHASAACQPNLFPITVLYGPTGTLDGDANVTIHALTKCMDGNERLLIPGEDDARNALFGDPNFGVFKQITVIQHNEEGSVLTFPIGAQVDLPLEETKCAFNQIMHEIKWHEMHLVSDNMAFLQGLQEGRALSAVHAMFLLQNPDDSILEIGTGKGCTALILENLRLKSITKNPGKFVSIDCDPEAFSRVGNIARMNGIPLNAECLAISSHTTLPLMQHSATKETLLVPKSGMIPPQYELVPRTISFPELEKLFDVQFRSLIIDCGNSGLMHLLKEEAHSLFANTSTLVLVESVNSAELLFVEAVLRANNMYRHFVHSGSSKTNNQRYQVWRKNLPSPLTIHHK